MDPSEIETQNAITLLKAHGENFAREAEALGLTPKAARLAYRIITYGELLSKSLEGIESGEVAPDELNAALTEENAIKAMQLKAGQ